MKVVESPLIDGEELEEAWQLYANAFATMNRNAVQRHLMNQIEFGEICADTRINKIRVFDDDRELVGITAVTTHLEAVTLIEPGFFAEAWPDHYALNKIWYVEFMAARRNSLHAYRNMVLTMHREISGKGGISVMDFCDYNTVVRHLPQITDTLLGRVDPKTRGGRIDAESYYAWRFDGQPIMDAGRGTAIDNRHLDRGEMRFGMELVIDLPGCNRDIIRSATQLRRFAAKLVDRIGMEAYGEPILHHFGKADVQGYTLVQLIHTSSITAHFSEAHGSAHINVFSCREFDADDATEFIQAFFKADPPRRRSVLIR